MGLLSQEPGSPKDEPSGRVVQNGGYMARRSSPDHPPDSHKIGIIATEAPGGIIQELRWDCIPEGCDGACFVVVRGKEVGLFESM